jgi:hypothetical protein
VVQHETFPGKDEPIKPEEDDFQGASIFGEESDDVFFGEHSIVGVGDLDRDQARATRKSPPATRTLVSQEGKAPPDGAVNQMTCAVSRRQMRSGTSVR